MTHLDLGNVSKQPGGCAHFLRLLPYLRFLSPQLEPQVRHGELHLSVALVKEQQLLLQL